MRRETVEAVLFGGGVTGLVFVLGNIFAWWCRH